MIVTAVHMVRTWYAWLRMCRSRVLQPGSAAASDPTWYLADVAVQEQEQVALLGWKKKK